jgi:hypothetical protein
LLQVRQSAGLLLKNNLKDQYAGTTEEFRRYIKVGLEDHVLGSGQAGMQNLGKNSNLSLKTYFGIACYWGCNFDL